MSQEPPSRAPFQAADDDINFDLLPIATLLLRRRRVFIVFVVVATGFGVAHALLTPLRYTATAMFTVAEAPPPRLGAIGGLGALATSLGANIPGLTGNTGLFTAALTSRPVLDRVLDTTFAVVLRPHRSGTRPAHIRLLDWYEIDRPVRAARLEEGRKLLAKKIDVSVDARSQIITLKLDDKDAGVAAAVAYLLLAELNRFNLETRSSVTHETRIYLERVVSDAQDELRQAEDSLRIFRERNRQIEGSANLQLREAQLQRQINVRQEVYMQLALQLEQSRSDEVKDTPVITVIQPPVAPYKRSWPRRKLIVLLWMVSGGIAAFVWVVLSSWIAQNDVAAMTNWVEFKGELERTSRGLLGRRSR